MTKFEVRYRKIDSKMPRRTSFSSYKEAIQEAQGLEKHPETYQDVSVMEIKETLLYRNGKAANEQAQTNTTSA